MVADSGPAGPVNQYVSGRVLGRKARWDFEEDGLDEDDLRYSPEHMWVRMDDGQQVTVGLCEEFLADRVLIRKLHLVSEGDDVAKDDVFGRLTTTGSGVFRLYSPVSGEVVEVNEDAVESPDVIIEDPYQDGWLIRVDLSNLADFDDLMTRDEYDEFLEGDGIEVDDDEELGDVDLDDEDDEDDEEY